MSKPAERRFPSSNPQYCRNCSRSNMRPLIRCDRPGSNVMALLYWFLRAPCCKFEGCAQRCAQTAPGPQARTAQSRVSVQPITPSSIRRATIRVASQECLGPCGRGACWHHRHQCAASTSRCTSRCTPLPLVCVLYSTPAASMSAGAAHLALRTLIMITPRCAFITPCSGQLVF